MVPGGVMPFFFRHRPLTFVGRGGKKGKPNVEKVRSGSRFDIKKLLYSNSKKK
jgi:hypothetical protein